VKRWLSNEEDNKDKVKAKATMKITWGNASKPDIGKECMKELKRHDPVTHKLVFCWAKKAHKKQQLVTSGQSKEIIAKLPKSTPLPQASTNPQSPSIDTPAKNPVASCLNQCTETLTAVEEEEEQQIVAQDEGHKRINALSGDKHHRAIMLRHHFEKHPGAVI
jgi:hypothetical protein